jgi:hypothetical protein
LFFSGWGELARGVLSSVGAAFGRLWDVARTAFQGIQDAFQAGNWGAIGEILKNTMVIAWEEIRGVVAANWDTLVVQLSKAWAGIWYAGATGFDWLMTQIRTGWASFEVIAKKLWAKILMEMGNTLVNMSAAMSKSGSAIARELSSAVGQVGVGLMGIGVKQYRSAKTAEEALPGRIEGERRGFEERAEARREEAARRAQEAVGVLGGLKPEGANQEKIEAARREIERISSESAVEIKRIQEERDRELKGKLAGAGVGKGEGGIDTGALAEMKTATGGTFNPFAAFGLGGGGVFERTAKAAETTAEEVKKFNVQMGQFITLNTAKA